jgi:hypothetical protein
MKPFILFSIVALAAFLAQPIHAQSTSGPVPPDNAPNAAPPPPDSTAPPPAPADNNAAPPPPASGNFASSAAQAVDVAKNAVDPSLQDRIVSVYGVGTPAAMGRWWVIFYDPAVESHGRAVKVENGQIARTYVAHGGVVYMRDLTFSGARVTGEGTALSNAQQYAAQHAIAYDGARALLRRNSSDGPLRWRVELMEGPVGKGFVFTDATNGSFAMYAPPGAVSAGKHTGGTSDGGLVGDAKKLGNDVKHTFLGIGGDLQEFFTGERTVDQ